MYKREPVFNENCKSGLIPNNQLALKCDQLFLWGIRLKPQKVIAKHNFHKSWKSNLTPNKTFL
jgi:hypothetical protein